MYNESSVLYSGWLVNQNPQRTKNIGDVEPKIISSNETLATYLDENATNLDKNQPNVAEYEEIGGNSFDLRHTKSLKRLDRNERKLVRSDPILNTFLDSEL